MTEPEQVEEQAKKPVAYISAPGYNNPQRVGVEKMVEVLQATGYETLLPTVSAEIPPEQEAQACLSSLQNADVVVVWLDNLPAEGVSVFTISRIEGVIEANFPPECIEQMQAGAILMHKQGINYKKKKGRAVILPSDLRKPPQVATGFKLPLAREQGKALCTLAGQPMNLPDSSTVFELGYAFAARKPIIAVALVNPEVGMYLGWTPHAIVDSFAHLSEVMAGYFEHALGSYKTQTTELGKLHAKYGYALHAAWRARLPKPDVSDPMDLSDVIPKEKDADDAKAPDAQKEA